MDVITLIFSVRARYFRHVLDGTNSMSRKKSGLSTSPYNIYYINCRNHQLALCLPDLMKNPDFAGCFWIMMLFFWEYGKYFIFLLNVIQFYKEIIHLVHTQNFPKKKTFLTP